MLIWTQCNELHSRLDQTSQQSYKSTMPLTAEQREAGWKASAEARKRYAEQRKALNLARPKPEPPAEPEQSRTLLRRLSRVRTQLDLVDSRIEEELAKTGIPGCDDVNITVITRRLLLSNTH